MKTNNVAKHFYACALQVNAYNPVHSDHLCQIVANVSQPPGSFALTQFCWAEPLVVTLPATYLVDFNVLRGRSLRGNGAVNSHFPSQLVLIHIQVVCACLMKSRAKGTMNGAEWV